MGSKSPEAEYKETIDEAKSNKWIDSLLENIS